MKKGVVLKMYSGGISLVHALKGDHEALLFRGDHSYLTADGKCTKDRSENSTYAYKKAKRELQLAVGTEIVYEAHMDCRGRLVVSAWEFAEAFEFLRERDNLPEYEYTRFNCCKQTGKHYLTVRSDAVPTSPKQLSGWQVTLIINGKQTSVEYTASCPYFANVNDGWLARMNHQAGEIDLYDALQIEGVSVAFESAFSKVTYQVIDGRVTEINAKTKTVWAAAKPSLAWVPENGDMYSVGKHYPVEWFGRPSEVNYMNIRHAWIKSPTLASLIVPNQGLLRSYSGAVDHISGDRAKQYADAVSDHGIKLWFNIDGKINMIEAAGKSYVRHSYGHFTKNVFTENGLEQGKVVFNKNSLPTIFLGRTVSYTFKDIGLGTGTVYVPLTDVEFIGYE